MASSLKPNHYRTKPRECIEIIRDMTADLSGEEAFCMGNIIKYLYRYRTKHKLTPDGCEDLAKAVTYTQMLERAYINAMEVESHDPPTM